MSKYNKITILNIIIIVICFLIAPITLYVWSKYILNNPAEIMGIAFLIYIYVGPVVMFIVGLITGYTKQSIAPIALAFVASCALILPTILSQVAPQIVIGSFAMLCAGYCIGKLVCRSKKEKI